MAAREVGRVAGLWRYPVKSMAAGALDFAEIGWQGLAGDRRWAFIREGMVGSGFSLAHHPGESADVAVPAAAH